MEISFFDSIDRTRRDLQNVKIIESRYGPYGMAHTVWAILVLNPDEKNFQMMNRLALFQDKYFNQHRHAEIVNKLCNNVIFLPKGLLRKSQRKLKLEN